MKKNLLWASLAALSLFIVPGCSKDDTDAPVITLLGDNPTELDIFEAYDEAGYTAEDSEDGDVTANVQVDNSEINANYPISIYYTVTDEAGNVGSETRTVTSVPRTYNVVDTCGSGASAVVYTYPQTVTMVNSSTIRFNKFADYSGNSNITATFTATGTITLPNQSALDIGSASEDHEFQGTGLYTGNAFVIQYTDKNNSSVPVATTTCRAYFIP